VAEQATLHVAAEPVLTPYDLTGFLSFTLPRTNSGGSVSIHPAAGELDQGLGRHLHLVSLGDYFGPCARARADRCSFAAAGEGTDDRSHRRSADRSLRSARPRDLPVSS